MLNIYWSHGVLKIWQPCQIYYSIGIDSPEIALLKELEFTHNKRFQIVSEMSRRS